MGFLELAIINHPILSYLTLFVGMFIDGESFFVGAAIFALQGYLSWPIIVIVAFVGVLISDITWYYIGRFSKETWFGKWISKRFNGYELWLHENFVKRYAKMAFYSKFIYYVNRLTPMIAGWHNMEFKKFIKIHFAAAIFWLFVMTIIGYLLQFILEAVGAKWVLKRMEFVLPSLIVIFLLGEYMIKKLFTKKITKAVSKLKETL